MSPDPVTISESAVSSPVPIAVTIIPSPPPNAASGIPAVVTRTSTTSLSAPVHADPPMIMSPSGEIATERPTSFPAPIEVIRTPSLLKVVSNVPLSNRRSVTISCALAAVCCPRPVTISLFET